MHPNEQLDGVGRPVLSRRDCQKSFALVGNRTPSPSSRPTCMGASRFGVNLGIIVYTDMPRPPRSLWLLERVQNRVDPVRHAGRSLARLKQRHLDSDRQMAPRHHRREVSAPGQKQAASSSLDPAITSTNMHCVLDESPQVGTIESSSEVRPNFTLRLQARRK